MSKSKFALLADDEAWTRVGEELRRVDPQRYLAILKIAEDICSIHRNPVSTAVADGFFMFQGGKSGEFD